MRRFAACGMLALLAAMPAAARDPDGRLGLLVSPNNAQPALLQPGDSFDAVLREPAGLRLENGSSVHELEAEAPVAWRGMYRVRCRVPETARPVVYTLVAETKERSDRNFRAVYVYDQFPETYTVARFNDLLVNAAGNDTALYRGARDINAANPGLILVTGNLTTRGTAEQFRMALEILNACTGPTLVSPGLADFSEGLADDFLGPLPFVRRFGQDGYLGFVSDPALPRVDAERVAGDVYAQRRSIRPSRWSIGFTGRFGAATSMRTQLTVLVDDPLDVLLAGPAGNDISLQGRTLWGSAEVYPATAGQRGEAQWFHVGVRGVAPLEATR